MLQWMDIDAYSNQLRSSSCRYIINVCANDGQRGQPGLLFCDQPAGRLAIAAGRPSSSSSSSSSSRLVVVVVVVVVVDLRPRGGAKASAPEWESGGQRGRKKHGALFGGRGEESFICGSLPGSSCERRETERRETERRERERERRER